MTAHTPCGIVPRSIGEEEPVELPAETVSELLKRLRRVEGQVRGLQQMLVDGRECRDVITQLSAARKALDQVGLRLLVTGLTSCLADPEAASESGFDVDEVERLFLKLT